VTERAEYTYVVTRHAPVWDVPGICWVAVACRMHGDGTIEWCLEYWDDRGEADVDDETPDEQSAVDRAAQEFGIQAEEWRSGPQPWGKPEC
jgi:hypothetical protein